MKKHERSDRLAFFEKTTERDEVLEVRKTLLSRVLLVVWLAGLPAICLGAIHAYVQGRWVFTVIYGVLYLFFILITLPITKLSYYFKAFILILSLFLVALTILVRLGMSGVGLELMIGVCFMASLFFGFRKGIVALFACSAGIALVAAGMIAGLIPIHPEHMLNSAHPVTWMIALCVFIMIVSLALIAPEILKRRVEESLDREERHKKELEIANQRLREEIQGHEKADAALRESEFRFRTFFNSNPEGVALLDFSGTILDVNKSLLAMSGYTVLDLIDQPFTAFVPAAFHTETEKAVAMIQKGISLDAPVEVSIMRKDGKPLPVSIKGWRITDEESRPVALGVFVHDLSRERHLADEKAALEKQLVQSQRIEAIGTLAGGIAHDFNNILGGIIGYTELALMEEFTDAEDKKRVYLTRVLDAGKRAKDLVQQILRFSRPHEVTVSTVAVTPLIEEAVKLLKSTLPKTIQIEQNIDVEMDVVSGDPTQIHQVIMNLCTNAYHAMRERGGVLTLSLQNVSLEAPRQCRSLSVPPGEYLRLGVSDTGCGIAPQICERIFDPYFTTKEKTEGSGLGLSVTLGIVKAHKGLIEVRSTVGDGTRFDLYFPVAPHRAMEEPSPSSDLPTGDRERILVVDDEPFFLDVVRESLEHLGYRVIAHQSSLRALDLFKGDPEAFDLVVTDQTMPEMTGIQLITEIRKTSRDIPIILCTGYSETVTDQSARHYGITRFLMKPVNAKALAWAVREALGPGKGKA